MPDVAGISQSAAEAAIVAAHLIVGTVVMEYSDTVALNAVISQNPASGSLVNEGSNVNLTVSLGRSQPVICLPILPRLRRRWIQPYRLQWRPPANFFIRAVILSRPV